ncbi:1-acyl-sn-glycerol-3-phosphate acyltransferase [uncultured Clostridium sp.]|uniref:lysophospholipid acyltransferase family protein n=1 Tax=uncultured Clostridium sp. TaxID=59620 RepID=UPI00260C51FC|nr:lysophospholipid acyltransferase family protein [uncultured Clostridium sp.]
MGLFFIKSWIVPIISKLRGKEAAERFKHRSVQKWCKFTFDIIGVKVEYEGIENIPKEHCLFVGNHQGILDIPALMMGANRTVGFIAKKELLKTPIMGRWIKLCHSVAIDREDPRDAVRVIKEGVENLNAGYSLGIYPEGTRAKDGKIKDFKAGSLKLAIRAKVPVVPVMVDGSYKAYELNKKFEATTIKIKYGRPIYTDTLSKEEQRDLANLIHNLIEKDLEK